MISFILIATNLNFSFIGTVWNWRLLKLIFCSFRQYLHNFLVPTYFLLMLLDLCIHLHHPFFRIFNLFPQTLISLSLWYHILLNRLLNLFSLLTYFLQLSLFHRYLHQQVVCCRFLVCYFVHVNPLALLFQMVQLFIQFIHFFCVFVLFC